MLESVFLEKKNVTHCVSNFEDKSLNSNFSWSNFDTEALTEQNRSTKSRKHSFMTVTKHN